MKGVSHYVTLAAVEMSGAEGAVISVEGCFLLVWKDAFVTLKRVFCTCGFWSLCTSEQRGPSWMECWCDASNGVGDFT